MVRKVAVLVFVVLTAAACGSHQDEAVVETNIDAHALAEAADHTTAAHTGKVHMTMTFTGSGSADATGGTITGDGAYDTEADLFSMTTEVDLSNLPGAGGASELDPSFTIPEGLSHQRQEVVQQGTTSYSRIDGSLAAMLPNMANPLGDKWLKMDLGAATGSDEAQTGSPFGFDPTSDPSAVLAYLKGAGAEVTTVGTETIDGVATTHVRATVSMKQALDAAGPDATEVGNSLKDLPGGEDGALADASFPVDVYLDGDNYVRRIAITLDADAMTAGHVTDDTESFAGMATTMTFDYRDLGQPVSIVVPGPDEVISLCDLNAQMAAMTDPSVTAYISGC